MFDNHPVEHDKLKGQHEKAIAERFIERYNEANKTNFVFKQRGKPPAPDFEYKDSTTSEVIGLEVTGVYYDEHHAEGTWQVARREIKSFQSNVICSPTERLRESIEHAIAKKCQRNYDFSPPIILALDVTRSLHDERDVKGIEAMARQVKLPEQIPFHEIYFGIQLGEYRIWKLYSRKAD